MINPETNPKPSGVTACVMADESETSSIGYPNFRLDAQKYIKPPRAKKRTASRWWSERGEGPRNDWLAD